MAANPKPHPRDLDMRGNSVRDVVIDSRTVDPVSPVAGQMWFRSDQSEAYYFNGTSNVVFPAIYGRDFALQSGAAAFQTTSTAKTVAETLNFTVTKAGTFEIEVDFLWAYNSASSDGRFDVMVDGVVQGIEARMEPKDSAGSGSFSFSNQAYVGRFVFFIALTAGAHTAQLRQSSQVLGTSVGTAQRRVTAKRVL